MARREFHFVEGSSSKFWAIDLKGSEFTVDWGRIGTAGQTQTKTFGSDAEAKKQYDKLIAEKTGKGYTEIGGAAAANPKASVKTAPAGKPAPIPAVVATVLASSSPKQTSAPTQPEPARIPVEVKREIHLNPGDWQIATWRKRTPIERPAPRPFDLESCVARLSKVRPARYGWDWKWETLGIPDVITRAEAEFWLRAMGQADRQGKPEDVANKLADKKFTGEFTDQGAAKLIAKAAHFGGDELLKIAANLLTPRQLATELLELAEEDPRKSLGWQFGTESMIGFRRFVLPYLSHDDLAEIRKLVEPLVDPKNFPLDHYKRPSPAFFLGALCGLHDKLLALVQTIPDDRYTATGWDHSYYHQTQLIVLGLGSPDLVQTHMRRLKLRLNREDQIRGWLATTELAGLGYLRDSILKETNSDEAAAQLAIMALVEAPEAALHMLELKISSRAPRVAREWLEKYPACAVAGLVPVAAGHGKLADSAIEHLLDMKRTGYTDLLRKAAAGNARVTEEVLEKTEVVLPELTDLPAWLQSSEASRSKLPSWASPSTLPALSVSDKRLKPEHVEWVLKSLQNCGAGAPDALLKGLRQEGDPDANDAFAWKLFELWLADGAPSKEKWAMMAIGHLGGDKSALKITPLIRNWPGESQHQRAVSGLECLRAIGSDTALMCLNGIAQKLKFKGLKSKAQELMEGIAADRKMSRSELEDRIVPDCDLDEKGTRMFDFGPRQFKFVLGPEMKAMVKDVDNKVKDLPAPNSKDDAAKAAAAVEEWKLLKKQIKEVAKIQAERLEQSMVTGRRWKTQDFINLLMKHPLMFNLVRLIVWGGYDAKNKLIGTFRVTDDQACANQKDDPQDISGYTYIGIVHALHVPEEASREWGQVFGDYEIVPPFQQLGRPVLGLEGKEAADKGLSRWKGVKIPATALVGTLERLAWTRGIPQDAGIFYEHSKQFPGADVTAVVQYSEGVPVGYMEGWDDQELTSCFFVPGLYKPANYPDHKDALALGKVDAVVISEVLKDMTLIASKGK